MLNIVSYNWWDSLNNVSDRCRHVLLAVVYAKMAMKQLIVHRMMENEASYHWFTLAKHAGSQYSVQDAKLRVGNTGLHQFQAHCVEMFPFWSRQF